MEGLTAGVTATAIVDSATRSNDDNHQSSRSGQISNSDRITITPYRGEVQLASVRGLIDGELSEPYTVYTYRYFVNQWPQLCFLAHYHLPSIALSPASNGDSDDIEQQATDTDSSALAVHLQEKSKETSEGRPIGVVIGKLERHLKGDRLMRGYIGMISVEPAFRGRGIAKRLLRVVLDAMIRQGAQEVVLETEVDNLASLRLYERMGFMREKRLHNFYLNGKDCFRLVLMIAPEQWQMPPLPRSSTRPQYSPFSRQQQQQQMVIPPPVHPNNTRAAYARQPTTTSLPVRIGPERDSPPRISFSPADII